MNMKQMYLSSAPDISEFWKIFITSLFVGVSEDKVKMR